MNQLEQSIKVGSANVIPSDSPGSHFSVVFEDDGETGYFYAVDRAKGKISILDALHIYNVKSVKDARIPSTLSITWSDDGTKALLAINGYPHAVFDFKSRRGYCRTNFPAPNRKFTRHGHKWSDEVLKSFVVQ